MMLKLKFVYVDCNNKGNNFTSAQPKNTDKFTNVSRLEPQEEMTYALSHKGKLVVLFYFKILPRNA